MPFESDWSIPSSVDSVTPAFFCSGTSLSPALLLLQGLPTFAAGNNPNTVKGKEVYMFELIIGPKEAEKPKSDEPSGGGVSTCPVGVALIGSNGSIILKNKDWMHPDESNSFQDALFDSEQINLGTWGDYPGAFAVDMVHAAREILAVLNGKSSQFFLDYPIDGSQTSRWYRLKVTPMGDKPGGAAVFLHYEITNRSGADLIQLADDERYRRQRNALMAFAGSKALKSADPAGKIRGLTETAAKTLGVARSGVWLYNSDKSAIRCMDLYDAEADRHSSGMELVAADYPAYFRALAQGTSIAVEDARRDPRTVEFLESYLRPFDITSMLEAPIHRDGLHHGVLCHGHIGAPRRWTPDEETFAVAAGNLVSLVLEEAKHEEAEGRIRDQAVLLDRVPDAILVRDLNHRILYWNQSAERLYGWKATEAVGALENDLIGHDAELQEAAFDDLMENGEWAGEVQQETRDGKLLKVESRLSLVRDDHGIPKSIIAINNDVTEVRRMEAQYLRAQRMESMGTLAGGIAHDLNNVLSPITMSVDLLKMRETNPESLKVLSAIESSAKRGADIVRQVLTFARGVEGEMLPVAMDDLIAEVIKFATETFPKKITVRSDIASDLPTVRGDATRLHQVLLNLCVNARDALPSGGEISISACNMDIDDHDSGMAAEVAPGPYIKISVEDNGIGMSAEVTAKLFEPFFTTKKLGAGTGLGLSTSLLIIKSHGGFVRVYSEEGKGTCFNIYFPTERGTAVKKTDSPLVDRPRGNGETILLIDDEASIREIIQNILTAFGYRVVTACDGAEAARIYLRLRDKIDLVITDLMMPSMDGLSIIRVLLRMDPELRIIAASGLCAKNTVDDAVNAGAKQFICKPYTVGTLLVALREVLKA